MKIATLAEIEAALDLDRAKDAIREGFIAYSQGKVQLGAVGYLGFPTFGGDCHIKSAAQDGGSVFAVKIASGFAGNAAKGLPGNSGLMIVLDATTGMPLCLLLDEGRLTDVRTAIAGALAAAHIRPKALDRVGIVGTGVQARMQAEMIARFCGLRRFVVWGRNRSRADALAETLRAQGNDVAVVPDLATLGSQAQLIVTTTASRAPLFAKADVMRGVRIVAMGADAPGKQEVDTALVASMDHLLADSLEQCFDHGELSHAHKAGVLASGQVQEFGASLDAATQFPDDASVLVDLTGLGVQDLAISRAVWTQLR